MNSEPDRKTPATKTPRSQTSAAKNVARPIETHLDIAWSRSARQKLLSINAAPTHQVSAASAPQTFSTNLSSVREINRAARRAVAQTIQLATSSTRSLRDVAPSVEQDIEVALRFVDDDEMRVLNFQYRGKNKPTDVLSFAQDEGEAFPVFEENATSQLGDLVISIQTAGRQATERGHSLMEEIEFLAVHGALHLLGFDHGVARERRAMWAQQDVVMKSLGSSLLVSPDA